MTGIIQKNTNKVGPMRIEYAALTDIGLKRSTNEDAFMIESELVSVKDPDTYYTDTSFRVARDTGMDQVLKKSR